MAYWQDLRNNFPETIEVWKAAANDHLEEAFLLLSQGMFGSGIYLLGYVAEIYLKCAFFEFENNHGPNDITVRERVKSRSLNNLLNTYRVSYDTLRYLHKSALSHSPKFWADCLIEIRHHDGLPLSAPTSGALLKYVGDIEDARDVSMRYHPDFARQKKRYRYLTVLSGYRTVTRT